MLNRLTLNRKRLIFDLAKRTEDSFSRTIPDLEAYYDRKLPSIGCKVEESIGVNREAEKLVTKVLLLCEHFTGTDHDESKDSQKVLQ